MFNLLIAIISSTYENYVEGRETIDTQELIEILLDFSSIMAFFSGSRVETDKKYVHIFALAEEEVELTEMVKDLSEDVKELQVKHKRTDRRVMKIIESLNEFKALYETINEEKINEIKQ